MRVQEKSSASCAKMTEERSLNGGPEIPSGSKRGFSLGDTEGTQSTNSSSTETDRTSFGGGRLKFFKDGKFILELSHRTEGDRTSWVQVPKKTFWPPPAAAGTPRQESSTSLSVSDDNSSVQSSPWQRDHCWKQNTPRQGINKELTFSMQALPHMRHLRNLPHYSHNIHKKRRCPYVPIEVTVTNITFSKCNRLTKSERRDRRKLSDIVQTLLDRVRGPSNSSESVVCSSSFVVNHAKTVSVASGRMDPSIISPRKRILREMERVSLEDLGNSKRQRARSTSALPHNNNNNNGSSGNCTATCSTPSQLSVKGSVSNYSITSLLGPNREEELTVTGSHESDSSFLRTLLKSSSQQSSVEQTPKSKSNVKSISSRKTSPTTQQSSPQISSPSNQASPTLSPSPEALHSGMRNPIVPSIGSSPHLTPFLPPSLMYPPLSSSYIPHPSPAISHLPYYSSRSPVPASYRGPPSPVPSFWVHYPFSSLPRGGMPYGLMGPCQTPSPHVLSQCPWGPISHQQADDFKKEDSSSDVPLNLSKHAG